MTIKETIEEAKKVGVKDMSWKAWFMIITIISAATVASYYGVNVTMNIDLANRVGSLEGMLSHTINSTFYTLQKPVSYIISTVTSGATTYYCMQNGTSGTLDFWSTNASAVIMASAYANTTIFFKEGNYAIDYLIPVNVSNIHFVGSGWGTQFNVGANGGFNITGTANLFDIEFSNIYFYGVGNSKYMITSAMANNTRIAHFTFSNNRVSNFTYAGTIALNLTNLEVSTIKNNYFYDTRTAFIQLCCVNYHMGNIWISDNVFYLGYHAANENAVRLTTLANDGTYGTIYNIWGTNNQYFAPTTSVTALAWNLTTVDGAMEGVTLTGERTERVQLVWTDGSDTYRIRKVMVTNCFLDSGVYCAGMKMINLDAYTRSAIVSGNQIQLEDNTSYFFMDNYTADAAYANRFDGNQLITSNGALISPSSLTAVRDNIGFITEAWGINTTAADGGTQAHGLAGTPTFVSITSGNTTFTWCAVNTFAATTFKYELQTSVLASATGQTVYWYARYDP